MPSENHSTMLQNNLGRIVETVLRTIDAEAEREIRLDSPSGQTPPSPDVLVSGSGGGTELPPDGRKDQAAMEEEIREQVTDLCEHVAEALRGMESHGGTLARYVQPRSPERQRHLLDVRR